jgi:hypothetical protein
MKSCDGRSIVGSLFTYTNLPSKMSNVSESYIKRLKVESVGDYFVIAAAGLIFVVTCYVIT